MSRINHDKTKRVSVIHPKCFVFVVFRVAGAPVDNLFGLSFSIGFTGRFSFGASLFALFSLQFIALEP